MSDTKRITTLHLIPTLLWHVLLDLFPCTPILLTLITNSLPFHKVTESDDSPHQSKPCSCCFLKIRLIENLKALLLDFSLSFLSMLAFSLSRLLTIFIFSQLFYFSWKPPFLPWALLATKHSSACPSLFPV